MSYYDEAVLMTYRLARWARPAARTGERRRYPMPGARSAAQNSLPALFRGPVP